MKKASELSAMDLLTNFKKHAAKLKNLETHEAAVINESMFRIIETEETPKKIEQYIANLELYIRWLMDNKRQEILAHWTIMFESPVFVKGKVKILQHSQWIFQNIVMFIKDIKL